MHWSPFLEIFVGVFLLSGVGLGWFTRIPVVLIGLVIGVLVFAGVMLAEQAAAYDAWNWDLDREALGIYFLLGILAAVPAFIAALIGRIFKRRRET